jgi:hypothetical protein
MKDRSSLCAVCDKFVEGSSHEYVDISWTRRLSSHKMFECQVPEWDVCTYEFIYLFELNRQNNPSFSWWVLCSMIWQIACAYTTAYLSHCPPFQWHTNSDTSVIPAIFFCNSYLFPPIHIRVNSRLLHMSFRRMRALIGAMSIADSTQPIHTRQICESASEMRMFWKN